MILTDEFIKRDEVSLDHFVYVNWGSYTYYLDGCGELKWGKCIPLDIYDKIMKFMEPVRNIIDANKNKLSRNTLYGIVLSILDVHTAYYVGYRLLVSNVAYKLPHYIQMQLDEWVDRGIDIGKILKDGRFGYEAMDKAKAMLRQTSVKWGIVVIYNE